MNSVFNSQPLPQLSLSRSAVPSDHYLQDLRSYVGKTFSGDITHVSVRSMYNQYLPCAIQTSIQDSKKLEKLNTARCRLIAVTRHSRATEVDCFGRDAVDYLNSASYLLAMTCLIDSFAHRIRNCQPCLNPLNAPSAAHPTATPPVLP